MPIKGEMNKLNTMYLLQINTTRWLKRKNLTYITLLCEKGPKNDMNVNLNTRNTLGMYI